MGIENGPEKFFWGGKITNIEIIPHMSNVFLQKYLPQKCNVIDMKHAKAIMYHLCTWLSNRGFTTFVIKKNE